MVSIGVEGNIHQGILRYTSITIFWVQHNIIVGHFLIPCITSQRRVAGMQKGAVQQRDALVT